MNQDQVKELLKKLDCHLPGGIDFTAEEIPDFKLTFTGKVSRKVHGVYYSQEKEILIHNQNPELASEERLIHTAIHEFAHHIHFICFPNYPETVTACHNKVFKAIFRALLDDAIAKNLHRPQFLFSSKYNKSSAIQKDIKDAVEKYQKSAKELYSKLEDANFHCSMDGVEFSEFIEFETGITHAEYKRLRKQVSNVTETINIFQSEHLSKIKNDDLHECAKAMYEDNTPKATVVFRADEPLQEVCRMSRKTYLKEVYESKKLRAEKLGGQLLLIGEELTTIVEKEKHDGVGNTEVIDGVRDDSASPELIRAS